MSERYPLRNPRVAWRTYDGEAILVSPDDSRLHALDVTATAIWVSADGVTEVASVTARLAGMFGAESAVVQDDVRQFLDDLAARGLVTFSDAPSPLTDEWYSPGGDAVARGPWRTPSVRSEEIFETTALACGKIGGTGGRCNTRPRAS